MTIIESTDKNLVMFAEVTPGAVFKASGMYFIKTRVPGSHGGTNLKNGYFDSFNDSSRVQVVDAEVIIK